MEKLFTVGIIYGVLFDYSSSREEMMDAKFAGCCTDYPVG